MLVLDFLLRSFFAALALASAATPPPHFDASDMTPFWDQTHKQAKVSAFQAIDQNAKPVSEKNFRGKLSLVNFFFADCPGLCPIMMHTLQNFRSTHADAVKDVQFFSFSVQPEKDLPPKLQSYARANRLDSKNWSLLTGSRDQIFHVGRDMFKADGSVGPKKPSFIHTRNVYLVDRELSIRGIYDTGDDKAMQALAEDLATLR